VEVGEGLQKMTTYDLFFRGLDSEHKFKLMNACDEVIDLLRQKLKLEKWECLLVVKTLHECFPYGDLFEEKKETKQ
jgi:hypothetical protein